MATPMLPVEFTFSRDWIHAGVTYGKNSKAKLSDADARMLTKEGAGEVRPVPSMRPPIDEGESRIRK